MESNISFRLPAGLKREMGRIPVNWSEEIRTFVKETCDAWNNRRLADRGRRILEKLPSLPKGAVQKALRADRGRR